MLTHSERSRAYLAALGAASGVDSATIEATGEEEDDGMMVRVCRAGVDVAGDRKVRSTLHYSLRGAKLRRVTRPGVGRRAQETRKRGGVKRRLCERRLEMYVTESLRESLRDARRRWRSRRSCPAISRRAWCRRRARASRPGVCALSFSLFLGEREDVLGFARSERRVLSTLLHLLGCESLLNFPGVLTRRF